MTHTEAKKFVSAFNRTYAGDKLKAVLAYEIKLVANRKRKRRRKPKHEKRELIGE
jgi:hypothetical protein